MVFFLGPSAYWIKVQSPPPLDILGPVTPLRNTISPFQFAFMGLLLRPPLAFGVFNELIMVLHFVDHTASVRHLILLQLRRTEAQTKKRERHVLKCYLWTKIKIKTKCYLPMIYKENKIYIRKKKTLTYHEYQ